MMNEALTMEDLLYMDGEPVWIRSDGAKGKKWYLVCAVRAEGVQLIDAHGAFHGVENVLKCNTIQRAPFETDVQPDGKTSSAPCGAPSPEGKAERHRELCLRLNELYAKKNHDYGDSFHETFRQWGPVAAGVRMSDKLTKQAAEVDDESVVDTLMDLANYAVMTVLELEE